VFEYFIISRDTHSRNIAGGDVTYSNNVYSKPYRTDHMLTTNNSVSNFSD
jgi:hypothetical protein